MTAHEHVSEALKLISALSVNGDAQDVVVAAKNHLRSVLAEFNKSQEKEKEQEV